MKFIVYDGPYEQNKGIAKHELQASHRASFIHDLAH